MWGEGVEEDSVRVVWDVGEGVKEDSVRVVWGVGGGG